MPGREGRARRRDAITRPDRAGLPGGYGVAGSLSRRNTAQYVTAATMAPATGPTTHTHQSSQVPVATAGPNQRAGFIAAPVQGPNAMMSNAITRPIVSPAVLLNGPRSSTAVPNTANIRKNVATASSRMP